MSITAEVTAKLARKIGVAAEKIIADEIIGLQEVQLLEELQAPEFSEVQKVTTYLERTPLVNTDHGGATVVVTNEYLYRKLQIPAAKMKGIREQISMDPRVQIRFTGGGAISIYYKRAEDFVSPSPSAVEQ